MEHIVNNKEIVLVSYVDEGHVTEDHLKVRETQVNLDGCKEGEVALQNMWVSVDPYLRLLLKSSSWDIYFEKFKLNQPITSTAVVGKVLKSADPGFEVEILLWGAPKFQSTAL